MRQGPSPHGFGLFSTFMPEKPDAAQVTGLVNDVLAKYNAVVAQIT
jgi:hypothetical protein